MNRLELFALMRDGNGGLACIYCDNEQHFVFERSLGGVVKDLQFSDDPRDFHDYTRALGQAGWRFAWADCNEHLDEDSQTDERRTGANLPVLLRSQRRAGADGMSGRYL